MKAKSFIKITIVLILFVCLTGFFYDVINVSSFAAASLSSAAQQFVANPSQLMNRTRHEAATTTPTSTSSSSQTTSDSFFFFNQHHPVQFINQPPVPSSVHCIGQSYDPSESDFIYRSCYFQNLCIRMNVTAPPEFVLVSNQQLHEWGSIHRMSTLQRNDTDSITSSTMVWYNSSVALGPIAAGWSVSDRKRVEWFPRVIDLQEFHNGYFQLDANVLLIPFLWHGAGNPGHVVWDNFLPLYKLLTMFGLWDERINPTTKENSKTVSNPLLLVNMQVTDYLFGACSTEIERANCDYMMRKLLPLMRLTSENVMFDFNADHAKVQGVTSKQLPSNSGEFSKLVCARQGVAGLGMLSDHGTKEHGQYVSDYTTVHNDGKSALVFSFRNMILRNMGVNTPSTLQPSKEPNRIIMSMNSSQDPHRSLSFELQQKAIESAFDESKVTIDKLIMRELSLADQLQRVSQAFVYMSSCGGSVVSATFLPRGACLILYFTSYRKRRRGHMRLDHDFMNNLAYIHVHWLPTDFMNEPIELQLLVALIQSELDHVVGMGEDEHK